MAKWGVYFLLLCCMFTSEYVTCSLMEEANSDMDLEDLRRIFSPPVCSENVTCYYSHPRDVGHFLSKEVNKSVEQLIIQIKKPKFHEILDLSALDSLLHLKELWILPDLEGITELRRDYEVVLKFESNSTHILPITKLHINVPQAVLGTQTVSILLKRLNSLVVLEISSSMTLNDPDNPQLHQILQNLEGKQLIALSLKRFQSVALEGYEQIFNTTEMLLPLRDSPLQYLDLSYNDILSFTTGIYTVAKRLRILDVSHNYLVSGNVAMWMEYLLHPTLEILTVDYQGCSPYQSTVNDMSLEQRSNLKHQFGYHDKISQRSFDVVLDNPEESISKFSEESSLNQCLKKLGIQMWQILSANKTSICLLLRCVRGEIFDQIPCDIMPSGSEFKINLSCEYYIVIPLFRALREFSAGHLNIPSKLFTQESTKPICLAKNNFTKISFNDNLQLMVSSPVNIFTFFLKIQGLDSIEEINYRNNKVNVTLDKNIFKSIWHVKTLLFAGNNFILQQDSELCDDHYLLEELDLSNNNLSAPISITHCHHLNSLDLSENLYSSISIDFQNSTQLKSVNFRSNRISTIRKETIQSLTNTARRNILTFDLSDNSLVCDCSADSLATMEFIQTSKKYKIQFRNKDHYTCIKNGRVTLLDGIDVDSFRNKCTNFTVIALTVTCTSSAMILIICFCMCYKYRYRIYTCYFHTCKRIHKKSHMDDRQGFKKLPMKIRYDAFISYAAGDRFWVHSTLVKQLEDHYGFKLCVHYRDFPVHGFLIDAVIRKITESYSMVVILSENSLQSEWCDEELKMAHNQYLRFGKPLVIIKLGKIPRTVIKDGLAADLLSGHAYIEWPDAKETTKTIKLKQEEFWSKIERAIYGEDFCSCCKYCNPCYNKDISLMLSLMEEHANEDDFI